MLRRIIFFGREPGLGQSPTPNVVIATEELASIPDTSAAAAGDGHLR
jgi:hypothetical protein